MNDNTIIVEKMINGGYGLARRDNGRVVLLQNSLPGEKVLYTTGEKRKNTLFGRVETVLTAHHQRIPPPCPYYGKCGGCDMQHCSYDGQSALKRKILEELFVGLVPAIPLPLPSPRQFGYRQRIRLQIDRGKIGFFKFRSSEIIAIEACLIAHPTLNHVLGQVLERDEFHALCRQSSAAELHFNPAGETTSLLFYYRRKPRPNDFTTALELAAKTEALETVFFKGETFPLDGPWPESSRLLNQRIPAGAGHPGFSLIWEIGGFCQVNLLQNHNLIHYVRQLCSSPKNRNLLDLFCGMGNFSIPLAQSAQSVVGVEGQGASIRCAEINSRNAGLNNTRFIKGSIDAVCRRLVKEKRIFDTTILDPPRHGIPQLAQDLAALTVHSLIYISCDPATLVRDIKELLQNGFRLISVQPFDMFPQTHHIETVALLEKN
jgi:23S rRNA (uracil1939-C5)-methyltransferase